MKTNDGQIKLKGEFQKEKAQNATQDNTRIQVVATEDGSITFEVCGEEFKYTHDFLRDNFAKLHFKCVFEAKDTIEANPNIPKTQEDIIQELKNQLALQQDQIASYPDQIKALENKVSDLENQNEKQQNEINVQKETI